MTIPVVGNGGIEHAYSSQKNLTILSQSDTKIEYKQARGHLNTAIEEVLGKKLPPICYKKNVNKMILILSRYISITDDVMIKIENLEYLFRQARNEAVKDTHDFSDSVNGSVYRKIKDNKPSNITVKQTIAIRYMEKIENSINNGKQSPIESNCNRIPFKQFITFSKVPLNLYPQSAGKIKLPKTDPTVIPSLTHYAAAPFPVRKDATTSVIPKIYVCTAPSNTDKTGDVDYAKNIVKKTTSSGKASMFIGKGTSKEILNKMLEDWEVRKKAGDTSPPILHLCINAMGTSGGYVSTGSTITPDDLFILKKAGIKVVVTAIEYAKKSITGHGFKHNRNRFDEYFGLADEVVFVDEKDRNEALNHVDPTHKYKTAMVDQKLKDSKIIPIPPTIDIDFDALTPIENREKNILCFGIIRKFKGISEYALPLAEALKRAGRTEKVIIVGSIPEDDQSVVKTLLKASYPTFSSKIEGTTSKDDILRLFHDELSNETPQINIEFNFEVDDNQLSPLFEKCRAAINFHDKGLSPHFSGVVNTLFSGMKNYGLDKLLVSKEFKTGGKYTHIGECFSPDEKTGSVANKIVADLDTLDKDIAQIKRQCKAYKEGDSPSIENVTKKFMGIYDRISK